MALTETFLELAPEFGGTRFGPFKNMEIRLGSDPASNDIVLPENLGVLPNHVKLISQGDGSFIIAPIERTAGVFSFRSGGSAKQVTSPVAAQGASETYSADSFALVTPEGPRFYILLINQKSKPKSKESDFDRAKKRLSGRSLVSELKRQGLVTFLTTKGGAQIQRWGTFIKTGAILRPRYLIGGIAIAAGWLFAGGLGLVACQSAVGSAKAQRGLTECNTELDLYKGGSSSDSGPNLELYTARILGTDGTFSASLKGGLDNDTEFMDMYKAELRSLVLDENRRERLRWVYRTPASDFAKVRNEMRRAGWPESLVKVLPYAAALEGTGRGREWTFIDGDSLGNEVCGRGPMAMTWRQGQQLGLTGLSIDASFEYQKWQAMGDADRQAALRDAASTLRGFTPPEKIGPINRSPAENEQNIVCAFEGDPDVNEDPRSIDNTAELIRGLSSSVGPDARQIVSVDSNYGIIARLVRLYAADFNGDLRNLNLNSAAIMPSLALNETKRVKEYAMRRAAQTLARSVLIPCMASLDPGLSDLPIDNTIGPTPPPLDCIILEGLVKYDIKK